MKLAEKLGQCKYYDNCAIFSAQTKVAFLHKVPVEIMLPA